MKISTTRFGNLEAQKEDIIHFSDGILGFENYKDFFVVDPGDKTLILWLQSIDNGSIAFPIIEPKIFQPDYSVKLSGYELESLSLENLSKAMVYTILTIPSQISDMSANMKAPIVINGENNKGRQIVLQDSKLSVKHEMYKELKVSIVNYASDDSRRSQTEKNRELAESNAPTSEAPQTTQEAPATAKDPESTL